MSDSNGPSKALWEKGLLWPMDVIALVQPVLEFLKSDVSIPEKVVFSMPFWLPPLAAGLTYRWNFGIVPAYTAGGVANLAAPQLEKAIVAWLAKRAGKSTKQPKAQFRERVAGPLHEQGNLRPIVGFNKEPALPRYPFSTSHMYALQKGYATWMNVRGAN